MCLEIPIETQRERLAKRDGKEGHESELLIACIDEHALDDVIDWDYRIPAIGDFRELALTIHTGIPLSNIVWGSTQGIRCTIDEFEGASA